MQLNTPNLRSALFFVLVGALLSGCAPPQRGGMVIDPATGLQFGSVVEKNIVVDSSQFPNNRLKIRIRNISGDPAFDLDPLKQQLNTSYTAKGYEVTNQNDNGLLLDINVTYSGQVSSNMTSEFAFLGAGAGGIGGSQVGRNATLGAATGVLAGATLGAIAGSYVTDDTYIIVAEVTLGVKEPDEAVTSKTIIFNSSQRKTESRTEGFQPFRQTISTGVSVYAGGRNVQQSEVTNEVLSRFGRILSDIL